MIKLDVLGPPDLSDSEGQDCARLLSQPKRLGLLVYLALMSRVGAPRRDSLLPMFWPELDDARARHALRQAMHVLRQILGDDVIVAHGNEQIGLRDGRIQVDALAFERALLENRPEAAIRFYRGPFLDGFHVTDAPDFERWVEATRGEFRRRATETARSLADAAETAGDLQLAVQWAERAAEISPEDETALQRVLRLLDRQGNRSAAIAAYEEFTRRLWSDYELTPAPETQALIEQVRVRAEPQPSDRLEPARPPRTAAQEPVPGAVARLRVAGQRGRRRVLAVLAAVLALGLVGLWKFEPAASSAAAASRVAVMPFRVAGADPALRYLREGMVDLISAKLTGIAASIDARTTLAAWRSWDSTGGEPVREDVLARARHIGAARVVTGSVVGNSKRLILDAALLEARTGRTIAQANVAGSLDSLPALVDALTATLLSREAGEDERRLASLTSTSLPALRAYLNGKAAYRHGQYDDAVRHFEQALRLDSAFALAGLALASAAPWASAAASLDRALASAWRMRSRLSAPDRAILVAYAGENFPAPPTTADAIAAWTRATQLAPDRVEAWYELGDYLYHWGPLVGIEASDALARNAFARALALDSAFSPALSHLVELAARQKSAAVKRLAAIYLARDSASDVADYMRWRVAVTNGAAASVPRFDEMPTPSLARLIGSAQLEGIALRDAARAAAILQARATNWRDEGLALHAYAMNRGRPAEARALDPGGADPVARPHLVRQLRIIEALYWDGDMAAAERAAAELAAALGPSFSADPALRTLEYHDLCVLEQWRLRKGDVRSTVSSIERLRATTVPLHTDRFSGVEEVCVGILEALHAQATGQPQRRAMLQRLDALMARGPAYAVGPLYPAAQYANLVIARLWEEQGDPARALAVIRRRPNHWNFGPRFLSSYLREEARLAALAGEKDAAQRAYLHYGALRPER